MKWLAALLVVLNVGAFIWGASYKDVPEKVRRAQPALQADKMRLLSEPGVTRVPRAPVRPTPAAPGAAAGGDRCFAIGPFPTTAAAAKAGAQLDRLQVAYAVRAQQQREPSAWQVLLSPPPSRAQAEAKRKELTRRGISEHYLILEGRNKGAISLGVFSTPEAARKQLQHLRQQGVEAKIDTRYRRVARFWLEGVLPAAPAWTAVEALPWEGPGVAASQSACPVRPPQDAATKASQAP